MTSEAIEQLLINSEKSIRLEMLSTPLVGWTLSFGSASCGFIFASGVGWFFSVPLALVSLFASFSNYWDWKKIKNRRAQLIWAHLIKSVFGTRLNGVSVELTKDIAKLYRADPRGETLPLSQAVRLVDTHYKQQQRLQVIQARLGKFQSIGLALRDKTQQLRDLGESHQQGETRLKTLQQDEISLLTMQSQILASCHRLELIVLEARKTQQMRQLHREINDLTMEKSPAVAPNVAFEPESLFEIERQITHEIETFLRLERETDHHLREL